MAYVYQRKILPKQDEILRRFWAEEPRHSANALAKKCYLYTVFYTQFGWVAFLVVCFLYKTNPNPRKKNCCGTKVVQMVLFHLFFLVLGWPWVGLAMGWGVLWFDAFSNPREVGKSQTRLYRVARLEWMI